MGSNDAWVFASEWHEIKFSILNLFYVPLQIFNRIVKQTRILLCIRRKNIKKEKKLFY
jgi:hypothetical protein